MYFSVRPSSWLIIALTMKSYFRLFDCSAVAGFEDRSSFIFFSAICQFFYYMSSSNWLYVNSMMLREHKPTSERSVFCVWKLCIEPIGETSWLIGNLPYMSSCIFVSIPGAPEFDVASLFAKAFDWK